jgi:hypothetical protein
VLLVFKIEKKGGLNVDEPWFVFEDFPRGLVEQGFKFGEHCRSFSALMDEFELYDVFHH